MNLTHRAVWYYSNFSWKDHKKKKMNPKHLIVLENRKKKLTQHFVYHQSNSFLKEHRMMKTSLRLIFSFQGRKMQKMVVTNLLSSRNQETSSEGHKTKKKIPEHHLYPYFFYLEHRKMKRNPKMREKDQSFTRLKRKRRTVKELSFSTVCGWD